MWEEEREMRRGSKTRAVVVAAAVAIAAAAAHEKGRNENMMLWQEQAIHNLSPDPPHFAPDPPVLDSENGGSVSHSRRVYLSAPECDRGSLAREGNHECRVSECRAEQRQKEADAVSACCQR